MVRRDADGRKRERPESACCACPAGASPVSVSAGAPSSRPQVFGGDPFARAGCRKPVSGSEPRSGERVHGPQHEVKSAASKDEQSESRAAHVTAKAMPSVSVDPEPEEGLGGVLGAARGQGDARNTRGPSAQLSSQQALSYKSKTKSARVQRESEGIVVPGMSVSNNAGGGKGPWFGQRRRSSHVRGNGRR